MRIYYINENQKTEIVDLIENVIKDLGFEWNDMWHSKSGSFYTEYKLNDRTIVIRESDHECNTMFDFEIIRSRNKNTELNEGMVKEYMEST